MATFPISLGVTLGTAARGLMLLTDLITVFALFSSFWQLKLNTKKKQNKKNNPHYGKISPVDLTDSKSQRMAFPLGFQPTFAGQYLTSQSEHTWAITARLTLRRKQLCRREKPKLQTTLHQAASTANSMTRLISPVELRFTIDRVISCSLDTGLTFEVQVQCLPLNHNTLSQLKPAKIPTDIVLGRIFSS